MLSHDASQRSSVYTLYTWATSGSFKIPLAIQVDQLAVTEMLIVLGVGSLIVLYSIGYMHGDPKERRFFIYLNMFLFSMLLLVMSANFALLLAGWGLVGLSSYLLIGFWYERPGAGGGGQEGVRDERDRRRRHRDRDLLHGARHRHHRLRQVLLARRHQHVGAGLDRRQPGWR